MKRKVCLLLIILVIILAVIAILRIKSEEDGDLRKVTVADATITSLTLMVI